MTLGAFRTAEPHRLREHRVMAASLNCCDCRVYTDSVAATASHISLHGLCLWWRSFMTTLTIKYCPSPDDVFVAVTFCRYRHWDCSERLVWYRCNYSQIILRSVAWCEKNRGNPKSLDEALMESHCSYRKCGCCNLLIWALKWKAKHSALWLKL